MFMKEINYLQLYGKKDYHAKMAQYTERQYARAMDEASEEAFYAAEQRMNNRRLSRSRIQRCKSAKHSIDEDLKGQDDMDMY